MPLEIKPGLEIPDDELSFSVARSGGPGGQHVNKTSSKVVVRFDFDATEVFSPTQKSRMRNRIPPRYMTKAGELVLSADQHRDQARNREAVRTRLADVLREALKRPKTRRKTKPTRASKGRRKQAKQEQKQKKARRRERFD